MINREGPGSGSYCHFNNECNGLSLLSHAHTKIPTLYEAIDVVIKEQDMYMLLEIKDSSSKVRILYQ